MVMREKRKRNYRKRIPYGMQNFEDVIREDCYYVVKTPFIEKENDFTYDSYGKNKLESQLAFHGDYKPYFDYIADCLKCYSSQRDKQKGEAFNRCWCSPYSWRDTALFSPT